MKSRNKNLNRKSHSRRYWLAVLGVIAIASVAVIACLPLLKKRNIESSVKSPTSPMQDVGKISIKEQGNSKSAFAKPTALKDTTKGNEPILLSRSDFNEPRSTGELNLLCAQGLPGSEKLDMNKCMRTLEEWATRVKKETDKYIHKYHDKPGEYYNSEAYFRILVLTTVLQQDYGVHYNPDLIDLNLTLEDLKKPFTSNSKDVFIHGLLTENHTGTCSSMPVLVLAIGRILGYPLSLVTTKAHLFLRWEDEKERINIEATSKGLVVESDDYYRKWPFPITMKEERDNLYLKSLSPMEEYAAFLGIRADLLAGHGRKEEAITIYEKIHELTPDNAFVKRQIDALASEIALENMALKNGQAQGKLQKKQEALSRIEGEKMALPITFSTESQRINDDYISKLANANPSNINELSLQKTKAQNKLASDFEQKRQELAVLESLIQASDDELPLLEIQARNQAIFSAPPAGSPLNSAKDVENRRKTETERINFQNQRLIKNYNNKLNQNK